jgi:hypothetical protein
MGSYRIVSEGGVDFGTYDGAGPGMALDAMAEDAGYSSRAECEANGVGRTSNWTSSPFDFKRGGFDLLVTEVTA